jgi:hypothetical protein
MKTDSQPLSTADLASAGHQPVEPIVDQPKPGSSAEPLNAEPGTSVGAEKQSNLAEGVQPVSGTQRAARPSGEQVAGSELLFDEKETEGFRNRWNDIQVGFVDEPRAAVQKADTLVAETIKRLADSFATGRRELESQWDREGDVSTETLRIALQRYRSFFNRLLSI